MTDLLKTSDDEAQASTRTGLKFNLNYVEENSEPYRRWSKLNESLVVHCFHRWARQSSSKKIDEVWKNTSLSLIESQITIFCHADGEKVFEGVAAYLETHLCVPVTRTISKVNFAVTRWFNSRPIFLALSDAFAKVPTAILRRTECHPAEMQSAID